MKALFARPQDGRRLVPAFLGLLLVGIGARALLQRGVSTAKPASPLAHRVGLKAAPPQLAPASSTIPDWAKGRVVRQCTTKEKVFALTFDDGPQPIYTRQVLAVLKKYEIRATFFMVGKMVKAYPQLAREVRDAGHVIANHSWSHPSKPKAPQEEIDRTNAVIKQALGVTPELFRPPYGLLKNGLATCAGKEGDSIVLWSSAGADWSRKATSASISSQIIKLAHPGGIALLHDGGGNRSSTVKALPVIIENLQAKGYRFVTIPQLLAMSEPPGKSKKSKPKKSKKKPASKPQLKAVPPAAAAGDLLPPPLTFPSRLVKKTRPVNKVAKNKVAKTKVAKTKVAKNKVRAKLAAAKTPQKPFKIAAKSSVKSKAKSGTKTVRNARAAQRHPAAVAARHKSPLVTMPSAANGAARRVKSEA